MRKGTLGLPSPRGEGTPVRTLGGMRGRFCCDFRCVGGHRPLIRHGLYRPRHLPPKGKARAMTGNFPGKLVLSLRQTDFQSVGAGRCSALFSSIVRVSGGAKPRPYTRLPLPFTIHPPLAGIMAVLRAAGSSAPTVVTVAVCHPSGLGGYRYPHGRFVNRPYGHNRHGFSM